MKTTNKKTVKSVAKMKEGGAKKCPPNYCPGGAGGGGGCVYCGGAKWAGRILTAGLTALGNKVFKDASKRSSEKKAANEADKKETKDVLNTLKKTSLKKKGGAVKSKKK
jgi:hypothetical protein